MKKEKKLNYTIIDGKKALEEFGIKKYGEVVKRICLGKTGTKNINVPILKVSTVPYEDAGDAIKRIVNEYENTPDTHIMTSVCTRTLRDLFTEGKIPLNTIDAQGHLEYKNILQRLEVTTDNWKGHFILSFLMGLFTPPVIFVVKKDEKGVRRLVSIDGQQRTIAEIKFLLNLVPITGTGTSFDGKKYEDLDEELKEIIRNLRFNIIVIDEIFATDEIMQTIFNNLNTRSATLNGMEVQSSLHPTWFRCQITDLVHGNTDKRSESAVYKLLVPNPSKVKSFDRQNEEQILLYAYSLLCGIRHNTQGQCIDALLDARLDNVHDKEAKDSINEIVKISNFMLSVFQKNFANRVVYRPEFVNGCTIKTPVKYTSGNTDEKKCDYTKDYRYVRSDKLSNKYFVSIFYVAGQLYRANGDVSKGRTTQMSPKYGDIVRGVAEKVFFSDIFILLLNGGSNTLKRSKILLKTILQELLDSGIQLSNDTEIDAIRRANYKALYDSDELKGVEVVEWRSL